MDQSTFARLLETITIADREFACKYVSNSLPEASRYYVHLGLPATYPLQPGLRVYPEDAIRVKNPVTPISAGEVVSLLWRDGFVPVWIDISVIDADNDYTYFQLLCADRFAADESLLYYSSRGQGPFGVKSPSLPPFWDESKGKFDLRRTNRRPTFQELPSEWGEYFEGK